MQQLLAKSWFFFGLGVIVLLGAYCPSLGLAIKPWVTSLVFCSMILIGFQLDLAELVHAAKNIKAVCLALVMGFIAQPLLAFLLGKAFFSADFEIYAGVILCAAVPTTQASSVIWTDMTGGNRSLAVVLMSVANFAGVFLAPPIIWLLLGAHVELSPFDMTRILVECVLLPIAIGQVLKQMFSTLSARMRPVSKVTNILFIWATVLAALSGGNLSSIPIFTVLLCVAIQYTAIALLSYYVSRTWKLSKEESIAVMFCSAQATLTFAALIGFTYFAARSILYVVVYHLFQQFMGQVTALLFVKHRAPSAPRQP